MVGHYFCGNVAIMAQGTIRLVDGRGRKYLTAGERERFLAAAAREARPERQTFALVLAHSGARLSEILALRPRDIDLDAAAIRIPEWILAWNPERIFCAWDTTRNGDRAAQRLKDKDTRVVRLRPALDGQDWNDMLIRERAGEPIGTDDRPID